MVRMIFEVELSLVYRAAARTAVTECAVARAVVVVTVLADRGS